ncbi:MAG: hypothetical protein JXQ93_13095 [Flavobacteriaceae bacterium]
MDNELKNSEDFIKGYTSKKSGFINPKDYFDSVEDTFSMKLREEILPKNHGFKTPNSYLDNLEDIVLSQVSIPKTPKVISLRKRIIRMIPAAAAASIALFIALTFVKFGGDSLTEDEIASWFESDIYRIPNDDITIAFEDIDLSDEETETFIGINEIENYLENVDTTPLLNEIN